jgi:hypothetical protein
MSTLLDHELSWRAASRLLGDGGSAPRAALRFALGYRGAPLRGYHNRHFRGCQSAPLCGWNGAAGNGPFFIKNGAVRIFVSTITKVEHLAA